MSAVVKIILTAALCFLSPITALPETLGPRMQQLSEGYRALITNMNQHSSHSSELYPRTILEQLVTVKIQMSDVIDEMGCHAENKDGLLCTALLFEERRLEWEILSADQKWREREAKKNGAKAMGNAASGQKGWVVAEAAL